MPATTVSFTKAKSGLWAPEYSTVATIKSSKYTTIQAPTAGYIEKIFIKSGENVKENAPLFQIYSKSTKAKLQSSIAENQLDKSQLDKITRLYKQKFISRIDFERAKAKYEESLSDVQNTQSQLDLLKVKSPFSGKLGIKKINIGDYVNIGDDLINIQGKSNNKKYHIYFMASENIAHNIKLGQKVSVSIQNKMLNAYVSAKGVGFDKLTRQIPIEAQFTSKQPDFLKNGLTAIITTNSGSPEPVTIVPQTAINYSVTGNSIFKVLSGKAKAIPIKIGERRGTEASVHGDIKPGNLIISAGVNKVHNNFPVKTGSFN